MAPFFLMLNSHPTVLFFKETLAGGALFQRLRAAVQRFANGPAKELLLIKSNYASH